MTDAIHDQPMEEIANNAFPQNSDSALNGILNLHDILVPDSKTRLLLSKPPIHQIEAGLNPLVDAAAYIFILTGQLIRLRTYDDLEQLHLELVEKINDFQMAVQCLHYSEECLAEYIPISSYILCTTLDDIISNTAWGGQEKWHKYKLLNLYNNKSISCESFLIILERFIQNPELYIDIMELIYICLNLGFKYDSHSSGFNAQQLEKVTYALYKRIRAYRGHLNKNLSPSFLYSKHINYFKKSWKTAAQKIFNKLKTMPESTKYPLIADQKNRFGNFVRFLNNKTIANKDNKVKLSALPWVLLIGTTGAGKTTLIEKSQVKFIVNKKSVQKEASSVSKLVNWDWWVTSSSVLIDVPGKYTPHQKKENIHSKPWDNFLNLIHEERGKNALNSVALILSYSDVIDTENRHEIIKTLSEKIYSLQEKFGINLQFSIVITKCDLIPGFLTFFSEFTQDETAKVWGACLPHAMVSSITLEAFNNRFNQMIKQINNQLIYRLQQERYFDVYNKFLIKNFPIEIERLKENLNEVIKDLLQENLFFLKGFYLTSAIQESMEMEPEDLPQIYMENEFLQAFNIMGLPATSQRAYFAKQLLLHGLTAN